MRSLIILALIGITSAGTKGATETQKAELSIKRDSAKIWYSVAQDYLRKNNLKRAILNLKKALYYDSTFVEAYLSLGAAYLKENKFDSAEIAYRKVAKINPKDSRGWQGLGFMYGIVKKDIEKGIEFYKKAIETDPHNTDAKFGLATLYEKAGKSELADSLYEACIKEHPEKIAIKRAYGLFLAQNKRYEKAIPYLEEAYKKNPEDSKVENMLLTAYIKASDKHPDYTQKALSIIDKKLAKDSTNYTLWIERGDALTKMGKYREAVENYRRAEKYIPNSPVPLLKEASVLVDKLKDYKAAREALLKALKLEMPDNVKAAAIALLADTYFEPAQVLRKEGDKLRKKGIESEARKKYSEAVKLYDEAIKNYKKVTAYKGSQWAEYASKQLVRAKKLRKLAWAKSQGIE